MYADVVTLTGQPAWPVLDLLYSMRQWGRRVTEQSLAAVVTHLAQWDKGEGSQLYPDNGSRDGDETYSVGPYVLVANLNAGRVSLCRVV